MLNNYFTLKETAVYLNKTMSGYRIGEIYTQEKNKLLIEMFKSEKKDYVTLEFSIEKGFNYLLIKKHIAKAKKNFAVLFEEVNDKIISSVSLFNEDRVICFDLDDSLKLLFTFFSNKANCFLTKGDTVINVFKDKDMFLQKNLSEFIPSPVPQEIESLYETSVDKFIKQNYRRYGNLYSKEVLFKIELSGKESMTNEIRDKIKNSFIDLESDFKKPVYILYFKDKLFYLSLIRLKHLGNFETKIFESINELVSEFIRFKFRIDKADVLKENKLNSIDKKIAHIDKKISGVNTQLKHCEDSESIKELGDIILQNIYLIKKGDKTFLHTLKDGNIINIKLKEDLSPSENAGHYFDKYKKQKGSVDILKKKIMVFKEERIKLENESERIKKMTEYKTLLKEEKKSEQNKNDETSRFRKFDLNQKYEVWVGRDSASNDLLTTKYSAQNDLWFHVRGASGSHTVLKVNNKKDVVDKESITLAASIAAYYSKARNASSVPVAYCEKKYVKKKKGFKQGSVVMEREKVIFVKPALPINN